MSPIDALPLSTSLMTEPLSPTVARTWTSGIRRVESRQQGREEALAGDRACRNRQVARDGRMKAAEVSSSLFVEIEDSGERAHRAARPASVRAILPARRLKSETRSSFSREAIR